MRLSILFFAIAVAGCSPEHSTGQALDHVPVKIAEVTYQWPFDGSKDAGNPEEWTNFALIPNRIWNETIGAIPSLKTRNNRAVSIWLNAAERRQWNIATDGKGLPLHASEHFKVTEIHHQYTVGLVTGEEIVNPPTIVVFRGEPNAYASCSTPSRANESPTCMLLLNDRGVQHTLPLKSGEWSVVPGFLKLYKALVGIPSV